MKISVIMPVYNEEKYIDEAIQSWVKQSLEEKELICIDDGSTDRSVEIINQYRKIHPHIVLLTQERQGAGAARNLGLQHATGEFVCFLDADDFYIDKNSLELLYETAKKNNVNVSAGLLQIHKKEVVIFNDVLRNLLEDEKKKKIRYKDFQYDYQYQCYIFKKSFLKDNNLMFPLFKRFQDPPFLVQALNEANEFMLIPVEFYGYRYGEKQIQYTIEKTNDLFDGLLFNLKFAYNNGLDKLFYLTLNRINEEYFEVLFDGLRDNNVYLLKRLIEAEMLACKMKAKILVLEAIFYAREAYQVSSYKKIRFEQKVEKMLQDKSNIVIYGAGNIGKQCHAYIKGNKKYNLVAWIDKYKAGEEIDEERLLDLFNIEKLEYDIIMIAIENEQIKQEIRNDLIAHGVIEDRIVQWENNDRYI